MSQITVIIPCYNNAAFIPRCLDSLLAQDFADWEAICVDDGSTDGSAEVLDAYAARDPRFRVIHQPNAGVSAARNAALAQVRAAALHLTPGTVSELVESLVHKNALRRVQNPNDRRAVMITVTEKSLKALHEAEAKISEYAGMVWRNFTESEKKTLLALLDRISRNLDCLR